MVVEEAKWEVAKEIVWLKTKPYSTKEKINSLEHLIGLERSMIKELKKKVDIDKVVV